MEFLLEQQAASQTRFDAQMTEIRAALAQSVEIGRRTREELRQAVRLGVQEARAERKRRKEADEKLASSQEALRQSLQAFIDSMKQPRNGHDKN